jgi:formate hydrogenlyase subunit 3/multisubunit Na+/H+ antiporter MnhD subunit
MNGAIPTLNSALPPAAFLVPFAAGAAVFLGRRLPRVFPMAMTLAAAAFVFLAGLVMAGRVVRGAVLTAWGNELRVDALSALLVAVIGGIGLLAAIYSLRYVSHPGLLAPGRAETAERRLPTFYGLVLWFLATMVWGCVTNNLIMLYVAVEATTLCSGLLVAFYWDRRALEAGYKYLMLLTIGITFALLGCVLLYAAAAATGAIGGRAALLISEVRGVTHLIPGATAMLITAFLVVGFGTKAGIAPFHPWLPDAHAEAPTPVSVLLSGVMIKMAIYALARTVSLFFPTWPGLTLFVVALGAFTMVLGIVLALTQDDLKRLLAYSSVSQMGYVLAGLGLGTYLGAYGGLFHLLNHALEKSLLFMCVGAIIYATGIRRMSQLGGLGKAMPITGACFFFGALAIAGLPPFNGFMSKLTIYLALADTGMWWAAAIAIAASVLTLVVMVRAGWFVFWGAPSAAATSGAALAAAREVPAAMWIPMAILAAACLAFGIWSQAPYPLLDQAARALATLGR